MIAYLELADYLLIANFNRIGLAESAVPAPQAGFGDVEAYPDFATKAAVRDPQGFQFEFSGSGTGTDVQYPVQVTWHVWGLLCEGNEAVDGVGGV